jgi:cytochrome c oxidase subunit 2
VKRLGLLLPSLLCACSGVQSPLSPAGAQADSVFSLFNLMIIVCGAMYVLVLGGLAWATLRRNRRFVGGERPQIGSTDRTLSRGLILWLSLVLAGLTALIVASFFVERDLASVRPQETLLVRVTGHQWWWRIEYRDPTTGAWIETANELHLPVGRTARIELGSADVIHSFWVPNIAGKMDVIPGRANTIDISPRRMGWFRGQCAEFCGLQHAHMAFDVKVDSSAEFAAWLTAQRRNATAPRGAEIARGMQVVVGGQCAMCHVIRGTTAGGRAGPDLTHVGSRRSIAAGTLAMSRGALQGWIAQPQAIKPGTMMPAVSLAPADADAAARYLESLK